MRLCPRREDRIWDRASRTDKERFVIASLPVKDRQRFSYYLEHSIPVISVSWPRQILILAKTKM